MSELNLPELASVDTWHYVFGNKLVLKEIMAQLQISDLKNCRLVSKKLWEELATECLKKKNWDERNFITLILPNQIEKYWKTYASADGGDSRQSSVLHSCVRIYDIRGDDLENPVAKSQFLALNKMSKALQGTINCIDLRIGVTPMPLKLLNSILQSQSTTLAELRIYHQDDSDLYSSIQPLRYDSTDYSLTQLKYLCLSADTFAHSPDSYTRYQLAISDLIFSKIQLGSSIKICLNNWLWGSPMSKSVEYLEKYQLINSLKAYEYYNIQSGNLHQLAEAGVQLEYFSKVFTGTTQEISQFLHTQRKTLKMLSWMGQEFQFQSTMENLTKVRLSCKENAQGEDAQITPILYNRFFPNLKLLKLDSTEYPEQLLQNFHATFFVPQSPCFHLQKFQIRNFKINAETIKLVSEFFPRLKALDIGKYNEDNTSLEDERIFYSALWSGNFAATLEEFVVEICKGHRREQKIWDQYELDSFFAGLNIEEIQEQSPILSEHNSEQIRNPSILKFKNLKKIEIFGPGHFRKIKHGFTDFSAYVLFGQLEKLKYLCVEETVHEFTDLAIEYLQAIPQSRNMNAQMIDLLSTPVDMIEKEFDCGWSSTEFDENERGCRSFNLLARKSSN